MSARLIPGQVPEAAFAKPLENAKATRLLLRRRMLLFSLPFVLLLFLLAGKFLSVSIASTQLTAAFAKADADGVHAAAGILKIANFVEPYKAWFNDGDGYLLQGDFDSAKGQFEEALRLVPEKESCKVRVNLVLTLEKLGDAKRAAGDQSGAKALYDSGLSITDQAPPGCFQAGSEGNRQGEGQSLRDSKGRLSQKSQNSGQNPQTPQPSSPSQSNPADPSKLEQLNQQQRQAQKDRADGQQGAGNLGNLPADPNGKQW